MKPPMFHVGQAVVCVEEWEDICGQGKVILPIHCPKPGPIYTVAKTSHWKGIWYLHLSDMPTYQWDESGFAPVELASDEAIAELLEEVFTPVTA